MGDHTIEGIIGIVIIVAISAAFFQQSAIAESPYTPDVSAQQDMVGAAVGGASDNANTRTCEADAYCVGSTVHHIGADCSMEIEYCQYGCKEAKCN